MQDISINNLPETMRALVLQEHGTLDQVQMATLPLPQTGTGDVLIEVKATALNRLDLWVTGGWPGLDLTFPHVLGSDCAGVIVRAGGGATGFEPGDRVVVNPTLSCGACVFCRNGRDNMCLNMAIMGEHTPGVYAGYAAVPARNLLKLPDDFPFEKAAAAALVFVTAWHSLITRGRLQAGESVLIVGAGGGVNTAAIQVAKLAGADPIYVVGSTEQKLACARELGADVLINRSREKWGKVIYKATKRMGVDVVVDNVGAATFPDSLRALKRGGRLLTVGNSSGPMISLDNRLIFARHLSIIGSTMGPVTDFEKVMGLIFKGRLQPVIDTIYPLPDGPIGLKRLADGDVCGKIVLRP